MSEVVAHVAVHVATHAYQLLPAALTLDAIVAESLDATAWAGRQFALHLLLYGLVVQLLQVAAGQRYCAACVHIFDFDRQLLND